MAVFVRLAHLDPQARGPVKSRSHTSGSSGFGQARAESQRGVAAAFGLHPVRIERERRQPDHHPLVGLARMARQGQRVVGVIAVVDVGDREAAP